MHNGYFTGVGVVVVGGGCEIMVVGGGCEIIVLCCEWLGWQVEGPFPWPGKGL